MALVKVPLLLEDDEQFLSGLRIRTECRPVSLIRQSGSSMNWKSQALHSKVTRPFRRLTLPLRVPNCIMSQASSSAKDRPSRQTLQRYGKGDRGVFVPIPVSPLAMNLLLFN